MTTTTITQVTTTMRSARTRALVPRIAVYVLLGVLCLAGLRAIFADPAPAPVVAPVAESTVGEESFAEGFVRAYLTWDPKAADQRQRDLASYLPTSLDRSGGLQVPPRAEQGVRWTAVAGSVRNGRRVTVTVAALTTNDSRVYLTVPVSRDRRGFLYISDYPALVGPPPVQRNASDKKGGEVTDSALTTIVERALRNYLSGAAGNLRADLTPDAVVTMPAQRMRLTDASTATWVRSGRTVEVRVEAIDEAQVSWTLSYDLELAKRDRWYVRSIQSDPTHREKAR